MRFTLPIIIAVTFLSACEGPQVSPEQRERKAINKAQTETALSKAKTVSIKGKTFRVATVTERNQALVELVGKSTPYFASDVEAASRAATGCNGSFDGGILGNLFGDIATVDLAALRTKISGGFPGWSVSLAC